MMKRFFPLIRLLCVLLPILWGCAPARVPQEPLAISADLEARLLEQVQNNRTFFTSLQGIARIRVESGGDTLRGTQVLLARKPAFFRVEALSPFGNPLLIAAADGDRLNVMVPSEGRFLHGPATAGNLQRFTRLPLELNDLLDLLLYGIPVIDFQRSRLEAAEGGYRLTLAGRGGRQEMLFDIDLRLVRAEWHRLEELLLRVRYDDFTGSAPAFPRTLHLAVPSRQIEASVHFTELELNPRIDRGRFQLSPPAGYAVEALP